MFKRNSNDNLPNRDLASNANYANDLARALYYLMGSLTLVVM